MKTCGFHSPSLLLTELCILLEHSLWSMFWARFVCVSWRCYPGTYGCSPSTSFGVHGGARSIIKGLCGNPCPVQDAPFQSLLSHLRLEEENRREATYIKTLCDSFP